MRAALDRWAEELVAASNCECKGGGDGDSLPPEIILKVMQVLRDEMQLRDETREAENSKPAVEVYQHKKLALALSETQAGIARNTLNNAGAPVAGQLRRAGRGDAYD